MVAAVVVALPVLAMAAVVAVTAAATSVAVRARQTPASHVKILATAHRRQASRVRHSHHAAVMIPSRHVTAMIPNRHATATSNSTRIRAAPAPIREASRAMTSTTSNPPATPPLAFHRPVNQQAVTGATSAADAPAAARVAVVAGATGLVGQAVLARLLADKSYSAVHAVGRRAPDQQHPKLVLHLAKSFSDIQLPPVDDVFIALGTTIKVAGSASAFRAIDFDAVVAIARAAWSAGASRIGVVSAMGADSTSKVLYSRVKGETESAVAALGFDAVVIARPSLLAGNRDALKQPGRVAEKLSLFAARLFKPLVPANYQPVEADDVAEALVGAVQAAHCGTRVLLSSELHS